MSEEFYDNQIIRDFWKGKLDDTVDEGLIASLFFDMPLEISEETYQTKCAHENDYTESSEYRRILNAAVEVLFGVPYMLSEAANEIKKGELHDLVYEAGRIVVSELNNPGSIRLSTIHHLPGSRGGHSLRYQNLMNESTEAFQLKSEIMYMLAGVAAIEVVFNRIDDDYRDEIEKIVWKKKDTRPKLYGYDFDTQISDKYLQSVWEVLTTSTSERLKDYYVETSNLIRDNRGFLDAIFFYMAHRYTITELEIARLYVESPKTNNRFQEKWRDE